ncbi:hypothetical protein WHI96_02535 [Pseudonocardia tropica]|uniref:Uncharacterized protein n=1 Tax=Pseudonocardia tropica TaxID=681289 RepID=A0ABV1JP13_9PSEU
MSTPLDHEWETTSRHRTSDGVVRYQRCHCGTWRVRLERDPAGGGPPETLAQPARGRVGAR